MNKYTEAQQRIAEEIEFLEGCLADANVMSRAIINRQLTCLKEAKRLYSLLISKNENTN